MNCSMRSKPHDLGADGANHCDCRDDDQPGMTKSQRR
jgi:hypothetical protein